MPYLLSALGVVLRFILWFAVVPYFLVPRGMDRIDRIWLSFMATCAIGVLLGHLFSVTKLYEPLTLWLGFLALLVYRVIQGRQGKDWTGFLQALDNSRKVTAKALAQQGLQRFRLGDIRAWLERNTLSGLLFAGVLGWTCWLFFQFSLTHLFLPASDGYLHLAWVRYMQRIPDAKVGYLYRDGIYPAGYHAVISFFAFLSSLDVTQILRFIGPIAAVLLILSLGYASVRLGLRSSAALVTMGLVALGTASPLPISGGRLISPLPQEFAAIFVLPAFVGAWRYLRYDDRTAGLIAVLGAFLTAAVHLYSLIYLALGVVLIAAVSWLSGTVPMNRILRLGLYCAGVVAVTGIPVVVALALGMPWHRSFFYVLSQVQAQAPAHALERLWTPNMLLNVGSIMSLFLLIYGLVGLRRREHAPFAVALGLQLVLLFTQSYGHTGIPVLMDPGRSGLFFALFLALAVGFVLDKVAQRLPGRVQTIAAAALVATLVILWPPSPPKPLGQYEYDDAAAAVLAIHDRFPLVSWNVVATQEQYVEVLGIGHHIHLYNFTLNNTVEQMQRPGFHLSNEDTGDLFVFVEKIPFLSTAAVEPDPTLTIPNNLSGENLLEYYQDPSGRRTLEAKAYGLMEVYRTAHPAEVQIFMETKYLRIYLVPYTP